jgi:hypothetical protein
LRKVFKIAGIALGGITLLVLIWFGTVVYSFSGHSIEFEATEFSSLEWKSSEPEMTWDSLRLKMADDLVENHIKKGQSKAAVILLLGKPDKTEYFKDYDMVYYLGRERNPIGIDSEWLVIKLNSDKVESFHIVRD